jgi:hypothetical protein
MEADLRELPDEQAIAGPADPAFRFLDASIAW